MTDKNKDKQETRPGLCFKAANAQEKDSPATQAARRECQHLPTPRLRRDEPMHPYGLD